MSGKLGSSAAPEERVTTAVRMGQGRVAEGRRLGNLESFGSSSACTVPRYWHPCRQASVDLAVLSDDGSTSSSSSGSYSTVGLGEGVDGRLQQRKLDSPTPVEPPSGGVLSPVSVCRSKDDDHGGDHDRKFSSMNVEKAAPSHSPRLIVGNKVPSTTGTSEMPVYAKNSLGRSATASSSLATGTEGKKGEESPCPQNYRHHQQQQQQLCLTPPVSWTDQKKDQTPKKSDGQGQQQGHQEQEHCCTTPLVSWTADQRGQSEGPGFCPAQARDGTRPTRERQVLRKEKCKRQERALEETQSATVAAVVKATTAPTRESPDRSSSSVAQQRPPRWPQLSHNRTATISSNFTDSSAAETGDGRSTGERERVASGVSPEGTGGRNSPTERAGSEGRSPLRAGLCFPGRRLDIDLLRSASTEGGKGAANGRGGGVRDIQGVVEQYGDDHRQTQRLLLGSKNEASPPAPTGGGIRPGKAAGSPSSIFHDKRRAQRSESFRTESVGEEYKSDTPDSLRTASFAMGSRSKSFGSGRWRTNQNSDGGGSTSSRKGKGGVLGGLKKSVGAVWGKISADHPAPVPVSKMTKRDQPTGEVLLEVMGQDDPTRKRTADRHAAR